MLPRGSKCTGSCKYLWIEIENIVAAAIERITFLGRYLSEMKYKTKEFSLRYLSHVLIYLASMHFFFFFSICPKEVVFYLIYSCHFKKSKQTESAAGDFFTIKDGFWFNWDLFIKIKAIFRTPPKRTWKWTSI